MKGRPPQILRVQAGWRKQRRRRLPRWLRQLQVSLEIHRLLTRTDLRRAVSCIQLQRLRVSRADMVRSH